MNEQSCEIAKKTVPLNIPHSCLSLGWDFKKPSKAFKSKGLTKLREKSFVQHWTVPNDESKTQIASIGKESLKPRCASRTCLKTRVVVVLSEIQKF